ncbi:hypothetical protein [Nitrosopumilus adriaticus]|uniref:RiboL-PSP-HEPN domain-containing protein n=1 Tax=Nitrosopumilus adriaticus TaxID=1580092 RepID=A0A0D5C3S2_9ARCH|nr:hypothetical protein [Nitrosopumilus adriaticus]AJW71052.1 hypothetical protein NADRNF5_1366 [Nitrosopumilus adriaticus]
MTKLRKHPMLDIHKIKNFDKLIPNSTLSNVMDNELRDVIRELDKRNVKISKQLKKYIIIRLVTIVESYLQNNIAWLVDDYDLNVERLFQGSEIPIPIKYFKEIQKKDFTKGKIIAANFNFQNSSEINKVFSNLLGLNFFDTLHDWIRFGIKNNIVPESEIHLIDNWDKFQEIFSLRNTLVHTLQTPHKIRKNADYFETLWDTTWHFINCAYNMSEDVMWYRKGKIKNKKAIEFFKTQTKKWNQNYSKS